MASTAGKSSLHFGRYSSIAPGYDTKTFGSSASLVRPSNEYANYDFTAFLGLVQRLEIHFFYMTWEVMRGTLGGGGQAGINEALVNVQISFAFKRFYHPQQDPFREIVQEIVVLSHPAIRQHKHIVRLVGICWDIPTLNVVWPVLVFEKSHWGDLLKFSKRLREMTIEEKLSLCADVGIAIRDMHQNGSTPSETLESVVSQLLLGIIHGDIKPENVLIFKEDARFVARVADFGFATCFRNENDLVSLPISEPWTAPEFSPRHFTAEEAKQMDVYSFGLLCFWLLFEAGASTLPSFPAEMIQERGQFLSFRKWDSESNLLCQWKGDKNDKLIGWASWLVQQYKDLNGTAQSYLREFFRHTLPFNPYSRCTSFKKLLDLLVPSRVISVIEPIRTESVPEVETFKIANSIEEFYKADFRLRSFIVNSLMAIVAGISTSRISLANAGLQLALCSMIGFGGFEDEAVVIYLWETFSLEQESFQGDIELIAERIITRNSMEDMSHKFQRFSSLELAAYTQRIDFADYYQGQGLLEESKTIYEHEIQLVQRVYGRENTLWWELTARLAQIMNHRGQRREAIRLEREALDMSIDFWGPTHNFAIDCMSQLSWMLVDQGEFEEAEALEAQIVKLQAGPPKESLFYHTTLSNLASKYHKQGRWHDAYAINDWLTETRTKLLGLEHPLTLNSMDKLATSLSELGQSGAAERVGKLALETKQKVLSNGHHDILCSMINLALTFWDQGEFGKCQKQLVQAIKMASETQDNDDPYVLAGLENLAMLCWDHQNTDEALSMMWAVEGARTRRMGELDHDTIGVRLQLQKWEESLSPQKGLSVPEWEQKKKHAAALDRTKANLDRILSILTQT